MPVRRYGIFLAFPPDTDMRAEGLGRYLANLLRGASECDDVHLVIACPSWARSVLTQLLTAERVSAARIEMIGPEHPPLSLRLYLGLKARKKSAGRGRLNRLVKPAAHWPARAEQYVRKVWTGTRNWAVFLPLSVLLGLAAMIAFIPWLVFRAVGKAWRKIRPGIAGKLSALYAGKWVSLVREFAGSLWRWAESSVRSFIFRGIERTELPRLLETIESRTDVRAWFSPMAFWPEFNRIQTRRLTCVPDVVVAPFATGFAKEGFPAHMLDRVEQSIGEADHLVTYSEHEKWTTLVGRYQIPPGSVSVIPHAASDIRRYIEPALEENRDRLRDHLCRQYLGQALSLSGNGEYGRTFRNRNVDFLFYASQFRPNKNILNLLRAYEYLLREEFIGIKLFLTGNIEANPEIRDFIRERGLSRDVLFLHRMPVQHLAACYRLARLAVNPSLSEGGCPFTFTEALSVDTPAVMARIPVTEEVIADPALQDSMLFDPYDWKDIAMRIKWALDNREELLAQQRPLYRRLAQRTWREVAADYLSILDRLEAKPSKPGPLA